MKPTSNPYRKHPGFGFRVYNAERSIRKLAEEPWTNIYTRGFDNCFESGDGDAVVFALMHKAYRERAEDPNGHSQLAEGIGYLFRGRLTLDGFPPEWEAIAWPMRQKALFDEVPEPTQFSLTV